MINRHTNPLSRAAAALTAICGLVIPGVAACGADVVEPMEEELPPQLAGYYSLVEITQQGPANIPSGSNTGLAGSVAFLEESEGGEEGVYSSGRFMMRVRECFAGSFDFIHFGLGTYKQYEDSISLKQERGVLFNPGDNFHHYTLADSVLGLSASVPGYSHDSSWALERTEVDNLDFEPVATPNCEA